jgi:hypothetical protein
MDAVQLLRRYFEHPGRDLEAAGTLRILEEQARGGDSASSMQVMEILAGAKEPPAPGSKEFKKLHADASSGTDATPRKRRRVTKRISKPTGKPL